MLSYSIVSLKFDSLILIWQFEKQYYVNSLCWFRM